MVSSFASCGFCPPAGCALCGQLSDAMARKLVDNMQTVRFERGNNLTLETFSAGGLAVLATGSVALAHLFPDGRRAIVGFNVAGEGLWFGSHTDARELCIEALSDITVRILEGRALAALARNEAELYRAMLAWARADATRALRGMASLSRMTASERLATFLYDFIQRTCRGVEDGYEVTLPMNREAIADHLGLKPETVSRQFTQLKHAGLIVLPRPGLIRVRMADALRLMVPYDMAGDIDAYEMAG